MVQDILDIFYVFESQQPIKNNIFNRVLIDFYNPQRLFQVNFTGKNPEKNI